MYLKYHPLSFQFSFVLSKIRVLAYYSRSVNDIANLFPTITSMINGTTNSQRKFGFTLEPQFPCVCIIRKTRRTWTGVDLCTYLHNVFVEVKCCYNFI